VALEVFPWRQSRRALHRTQDRIDCDDTDNIGCGDARAEGGGAPKQPIHYCYALFHKEILIFRVHLHLYFKYSFTTVYNVIIISLFYIDLA
jgi:hypothetical protein